MFRPSGTHQCNPKFSIFFHFFVVIQFRVTTQLCGNIISFVIQFKVFNLCQQSLNKIAFRYHFLQRFCTILSTNSIAYLYHIISSFLSHFFLSFFLILNFSLLRIFFVFYFSLFFIFIFSFFRTFFFSYLFFSYLSYSYLFTYFSYFKNIPRERGLRSEASLSLVLAIQARRFRFCLEGANALSKRNQIS